MNHYTYASVDVPPEHILIDGMTSIEETYLLPSVHIDR